MMLRGSAGELLRSAVTPFIQNMSEAHFPCHKDPPIIDLWKMIIGKYKFYLEKKPIWNPQKSAKIGQRMSDDKALILALQYFQIRNVD